MTVDTKDVNDMLNNIVSAERDRQRPTLQLVVDTLDQIFEAMPSMGIIPDESKRGPDSWTWIVPGALYKTYTVALSAEYQDHPLLTIRQVISSRLDSNLVTSALIIGKDPEGIERSLTSAVVQHSGAYSGLHSTLSVIVENGLVAGLSHAMNIGGCNVTDDDITSGRALDELKCQGPTGSGEMN